MAINESTDPAVIESEIEVEDSFNQFEVGELKLKCQKNVASFPREFLEIREPAKPAWGKEKGS